MSSKKVPLGGKPTAKRTVQDPAADAWVSTRSEEEPMKRLTIDIPARLHAQLKADCAMRGRKMADEIRDLLADKYGKS
ncbi:plasmid segregation centromere-binding protein ParG [Modicisalibacter xianhensis]|uniref:Plasmid segregation centromere-binding protein ParG n=1 Tax=Modicisalibacter xianhensis TaxID=442341 RepID=A0A4R8FBE0_9GAMM|nr:hypothetical protein [Halomonas xianhensis]TDX22956.1 plasmid segregation centromere-binding protein ParG [Halomonas xianhensis]